MASDPFSTIQQKINDYVAYINKNKSAQLGVVVCAVAGGESQVLCSSGVRIRTRGGDNEDLTSTTPFEIGSVSKLFTVGIYNMLQDGDFGLDLSSLLPDWKISSTAGQITAQELMAYSSGFPQDNGDKNCPCPCLDGANRTLSQLASYLSGYTTPTYTPGEAYSYSNLGMSVASIAALNLQHGTPDLEFSDELNGQLINYCKTFGVDTNSLTTMLYNQINPNGLPSGYTVKDGQYTLDLSDPCSIVEYGSGGVVSTGDDMMAFLQYCMSPKYPAILQQPVWPKGLPGMCPPNAIVNPGYGWFVEQKLPIVVKDGAVPGFTSWIGLQPYSSTTTDPCGLAIMVNGPNATGLGKAYLEILMGLSAGALDIPDRSVGTP